MRTLLVLLTAAISAGCSNHPLVDEPTDLSANDIVRKVKCEAKPALLHFNDEKGFDAKRIQMKIDDETIENEQKRLKTLSRGNEDDTTRLNRLRDEAERVNQAVDITARKSTSFLLEAADIINKNPTQEELDELSRKAKEYKTQSDRAAYELKAAKVQIAEVEKNLGPYSEDSKKLASLIEARGKTYAKMTTFDASVMALQFRFEITENNNASVSGSAIWPITLGTITLGYSAGDTKRRLSKRVVKVAATFADLLQFNCDDVQEVASERAQRYPITGNVGVGEVVGQYLEIAAANKLSSGQAYTDTLTFTTTIAAGLSPSIDLKSANVAVKANGILGADRSDLHEVIVDLGPPESKDKEAKVAAVTQGLKIEKVPDLTIRLRDDQGNLVYPAAVKP